MYFKSVSEVIPIIIIITLFYFISFYRKYQPASYVWIGASANDGSVRK